MVAPTSTLSPISVILCPNPNPTSHSLSIAITPPSYTSTPPSSTSMPPSFTSHLPVLLNPPIPRPYVALLYNPSSTSILYFIPKLSTPHSSTPHPPLPYLSFPLFIFSLPLLSSLPYPHISYNSLLL